MMMPAISIRQPWSWAILNLGKNVENRTWPTNHRGPILIHAGKAFAPDEVRADVAACKSAATKSGHPFPEHLTIKELLAQTGGIVGMVDVVDCIQNSSSPWANPNYGTWHWVLEHPRVLPFYPCRGRLGLFQVDYPHGEVRYA